MPTYDYSKSDLGRREAKQRVQHESLMEVISHFAINMGHCIIVVPSEAALAAADKFRAEQKKPKE